MRRRGGMADDTETLRERRTSAIQDLLTFEGCKMGVIDPQDELRHQAVWRFGDAGCLAAMERAGR